MDFVFLHVHVYPPFSAFSESLFIVLDKVYYMWFLSFPFFIFSDFTKKELIGELLRQTRTDHAKQQRMSSFVLCILSEGSHDAVTMSDGNIVYFSEIADLLDSNSFPAMRGKPKLIFLDISSNRLQGDSGLPIPRRSENGQLTTRPQHHVIIQQSSNKFIANGQKVSTNNQSIEYKPNKVACKSDFVFCMASFPYYSGLHNKQIGSIATRVLTEVFYKHAFDTHLIDLTYKMRRKLVSERFAQKRQVITTTDTLTKDFYLFPTTDQWNTANVVLSS